MIVAFFVLLVWFGVAAFALLYALFLCAMLLLVLALFGLMVVNILGEHFLVFIRWFKRVFE